MNRPYLTSYAFVAIALVLLIAWGLGSISGALLGRSLVAAFSAFALITLGYQLRETIRVRRTQRAAAALSASLTALREKLPPPKFIVAVADGLIRSGDLVIIENGRARRSSSLDEEGPLGGVQ